VQTTKKWKQPPDCFLSYKKFRRLRSGGKAVDRRKFLAGAGIGTVAAAALSMPAIAQGVRELKMVTTWPKNLPGLGMGAERVAQSITALSGGRLQVKVFGAGQMVGAFESFDAVSSGVADMYHSSEITWAGKSPAFSFFCNVPFGFTAAELNAWVYFGGGQALWNELSAGFGLKPILCGNTGPQMGGWFTKELTDIESFKGMRYRMPGPGGEVLRRLGAVVVNVPGGEIIASLRSGAIDASEFAGPWMDIALGLHKAAKYYYYPGFHEPGAAISLVINKKLWDSLGSTERSIIETAAAAENVHSLAEFTANNAVALETLANDPAIQIRKVDDSTLQALGKISGEVLAEMSRKDELTRRVYDSFMKFRKAAVRWAEISDRGYLNARALKYPYGD
jgi:TRAP-type mannitol/chloroaromatic compound transport system substrate-binding protein